MTAPELLGAPRVALYGGTFDPIHAAHLFVVRTAREMARLDGVVLVPAARSPHKLEREQTSEVHRLAMCRLAAADDPALDVWDTEIERGGVSFTVDTVERARELRGAGAPDPFLLVGSDQLDALDRWHRVEDLLRLARPLIVRRVPMAAVERALARLATLLPPDVVARLRAGALDVDAAHPASATRLRALMAAGGDSREVREWLQDGVADYARANGLYGPGAERA